MNASEMGDKFFEVPWRHLANFERIAVTSIIIAPAINASSWFADIEDIDFGENAFGISKEDAAYLVAVEDQLVSEVERSGMFQPCFFVKLENPDMLIFLPCRGLVGLQTPRAREFGALMRGFTAPSAIAHLLNEEGHDILPKVEMLSKAKVKEIRFFNTALTLAIAGELPEGFSDPVTRGDLYDSPLAKMMLLAEKVDVDHGYSTTLAFSFEVEELLEGGRTVTINDELCRLGDGPPSNAVAAFEAGLSVSLSIFKEAVAEGKANPASTLSNEWASEFTERALEMITQEYPECFTDEGWTNQPSLDMSSKSGLPEIGGRA